MKCAGLFFLAALAFLAFAGGARAVTDIAGCSNLTTAGEVYNLTGNVSTTGSCMQVSNSDITLECNNYWLSGDNGASDFGIRWTWSLDNITLQNCNVARFGRAVSAFQGNSQNVSLLNFTVMNASGIGILLGGASTVWTSVLLDNVFVNFSTAQNVYLDGNMNDTIIRNSKFNGTSSSSYTNVQMDTTSAWNLTLLNNTFYNHLRYGFEATSSVTNVWVERNTFVLPGSSIASLAFIPGGDNGTLLNNTFVNGTATAYQWNVANSLITANTFYRTGGFSASGANTTFTGNNMSFTSGGSVSGADGRWFGNMLLNVSSISGCSGQRCLMVNETSVNSAGYYDGGQGGLVENLTVTNGTEMGVYSFNVNVTIRNVSVSFTGAGGSVGLYCDACSNLTVENFTIQDTGTQTSGVYISQVCDEAGYGYNPYYRLKDFWLSTSTSTGHAVFFGDDYGFGCATDLDNSYLSNFTILGDWDGSSVWGNGAEVYFDGVNGLLFDNSTINNPASTTDLIRHDAALGGGTSANNTVRNVNMVGGNTALRPTTCTTCVVENNQINNPSMCFLKENEAEFGVFKNNTCDLSASLGLTGFQTKAGLGATGGEISYNNFTLAQGSGVAIAWAGGVGGSGYNISYNEFWRGTIAIQYIQSGSGFLTSNFISPLIHNNSFRHQTSSAIELGGSSGTRLVTNANVSNNYFLNVSGACVKFNLKELGGFTENNVCENSTTGAFFTAANANTHNSTRDTARYLNTSFLLNDASVVTTGSVVGFTGVNNSYELYCQDCDNWFFTNGSFTNTQIATVFFAGTGASSNNTFLNQTGNYALYSFANAGDNFTVQWFIRANVSYANGTPAVGANYTLYDAFGTQVDTAFADATGLTGYTTQNQTTLFFGGAVNYSPHNATAALATSFNSILFNINHSGTLPLVLTPPAPAPVSTASGWEAVGIGLLGFLLYFFRRRR